MFQSFWEFHMAQWTSNQLTILTKPHHLIHWWNLQKNVVAYHELDLSVPLVQIGFSGLSYKILLIMSNFLYGFLYKIWAKMCGFLWFKLSNGRSIPTPIQYFKWCHFDPCFIAIVIGKLYKSGDAHPNFSQSRWHMLVTYPQVVE